MPSLLPAWVKTRKDKNGEVFVVNETEKQESVRLAKEIAAAKKKVPA
jgi:hypothetical protein